MMILMTSRPVGVDLQQCEVVKAGGNGCIQMLGQRALRRVATASHLLAELHGWPGHWAHDPADVVWSSGCVPPCAGDEEEVVVMGGEGFTPEQIKEAEADFERRLGISLTGGWAAWLACP